MWTAPRPCSQAQSYVFAKQKGGVKVPIRSYGSQSCEVVTLSYLEQAGPFPNRQNQIAHLRALPSTLDQVSGTSSSTSGRHESAELR